MEVPKPTTFAIVVNDSPLPPAPLPFLHAFASSSSDGRCEALPEKESSDKQDFDFHICACCGSKSGGVHAGCLSQRSA